MCSSAVHKPCCFICIVSRYCWEESFLSNLCLGWGERGWNSLWEWEIVVKLTDDSWKGSPDFFCSAYPEFLTACTALCRCIPHSGALKFTWKLQFSLGTWFDYSHPFKKSNSSLQLFFSCGSQLMWVLAQKTWNQFGIQTLWLFIYLLAIFLYVLRQVSRCFGCECYNAALLCSFRSVTLHSYMRVSEWNHLLK